MKSLWFVVLSYIFSIVSGFSPFREDRNSYSGRQYDLASLSSSFDGSIDYPATSDDNEEEFDISFNTLRYKFHDDTKTRSQRSSSDRTNRKGENHDNMSSELLLVRSPYISSMNVMERNDKDGDEEEDEEFSVHWYEYIDAGATEDVDTDFVVDESKILAEEDSSITSSMFSLEDRYESEDVDSKIPFVVVVATTAAKTTPLNSVNENKEAMNLDRRMHSLGMISVHCEMEMLKFK